MAGPTKRRRACRERFGAWATQMRPQVSVLVASKNFLSSVQVRIDGSKKPPSDRSEKPFAVSVLCTLDLHDWNFSSMCHWQNRPGNLEVSGGHRLFSVRCRCRGTRPQEAWRVGRTALYRHPFIHSLMGWVWRELKPARPCHVPTVISTSQM